MPVSYDKLWKLLIDKKMKHTELKDAAGISFNALAEMEKMNLSPWKVYVKYVPHFCSTLVIFEYKTS